MNPLGWEITATPHGFWDCSQTSCLQLLDPGSQHCGALLGLHSYGTLDPSRFWALPETRVCSYQVLPWLRAPSAVRL